MKKILFLCTSDTCFIDENKTIYFGSSFTEDFWKRYIELCDELVVVCRKDSRIYRVDDAQKMFNEIPSGKVSLRYIVNPRNDLKTFLSRKVKADNFRVLEDGLKNADVLIIRTSFFSAHEIYGLTRKYEVKVLKECIGCFWDVMWNYNWKGKLLAPFLFCKERRIVKNADAVCYVTERFLQKRYPTSGKEIAVSDVDIPPCTNEVLARRLKKIDGGTNRLVIGTIAAVDVKYKGQEYVIRALAQMKKERACNLEYQMVGAGDNRALKLLAEKLGVADLVVFCGALPHEKVIEWLDGIDIYIHPSLTEGLSRAVVEAMSRACPCIVSKVGGMPELIEEQWQFKKKKVKEIVRLIAQFDSQQMRNQAERNFEYAKRYETDKLAEKRKNFYEEFVNAGKCDRIML